MNIILEPKFEEVSWFKGLADYLHSFSLRKKVVFNKLTSADEITNAADCSPVIVIGTTYDFIATQIRALQDKNRHPILISNQVPESFSGDYSYVSVDTKRTVEDLINCIQNTGKNKIALFGANSSSAADIGRIKAFSVLCGEKDIFYNKETLEDTVNAFLPFVKNYEAIICTNSFAAASLYKKLSKNGYDLPIIASANYSEILSNYKEILAVSFDFKNYLSAAIKIHKIMESSKHLSGMRAIVKHELILPVGFKTDDAENLQNPNKGNTSNMFFNDEELKNISKMDSLLSKCDDVDRKIIDLIIAGETYFNIAEKTFLSVSTVKYRISNMMEICSIKSKSRFKDFLVKYI